MNKYEITLFISTGIVITLLCCLGALHYLDDEYIITLTDKTNHDRVSHVSAESDSMGLMMQGYDGLYSINISNTEMQLGYVYTFIDDEDNKSFIIHRYVYDCTDGCYGYIFKGDNNRKAELVQPHRVVSRLKSIEYR